MTTHPERPLVPPSPRTPAGAPPATPAGDTAYPGPAAWGPPPPQPYAGWPPPGLAQGPPADPTATEALRKARTALGWAVGAAVGAGLAMIGMFVALVIAGAGAADDFGFETLRGEVTGLSGGAGLTGDRLEEVLIGALDDIGVDADVQCPDTPAVSVSTVVVCTGDVDGYVWTGVVVFEDSEGSFAVAEL